MSRSLPETAFSSFRIFSHFLPVLLISIIAVGCGKEQEEKLTNKDIYLYQGSDRDEKLIANAKKEGAVNIYTSMQERDLSPLTEAFERKYGIKTRNWRASPEKVVQRVGIEEKADRYEVDVVEMRGQEMEMLYRQDFLEEFYSSQFRDIAPEAFPKHKHYVPDRLNLFVMAYNTKLVKPGQVPNSYEDLLNPKWRGKISMDSGDVEWFAAVIKGMGEAKGLDYFKKLAKLKPSMRNGHTLLAEMTASGEVPIALNAYNYSVEKLKQKEEAIDWKPLQPAFGQPGVIGLMKNAPHPYAALLFTDFILSKEGQEIIKERGRAPISRAVDTPLTKFKYQLIDSAIVLDERDKWDKLWSDLFLGGKAVQKEEEK